MRPGASTGHHPARCYPRDVAITYRTLNPTNGELVRTYPLASDVEVDAQIDNSSKSFEDWRRRPVGERVAPLRIRGGSARRAGGCPGGEDGPRDGETRGRGRAEAIKSAAGCRWCAEHAERLLADDPRESDGSAAFVRYDPLGPVLAIMPWNFPFWQFFRFAAPGLSAGNTVLLKHSPNTPGCALEIVSLMRDAGSRTASLARCSSTMRRPLG